MNPRVKAVSARSDYTLEIEFTNEEIRIFDVKPYLEFGIFRELKDYNKFRFVKPFLGSIQWDDGQDFCVDTLYMESKKND